MVKLKTQLLIFILDLLYHHILDLLPPYLTYTCQVINHTNLEFSNFKIKSFAQITKNAFISDHVPQQQPAILYEYV